MEPRDPTSLCPRGRRRQRSTRYTPGHDPGVRNRRQARSRDGGQLRDRPGGSAAAGAPGGAAGAGLPRPRAGRAGPPRGGRGGPPRAGAAGRGRVRPGGPAGGGARVPLAARPPRRPAEQRRHLVREAPPEPPGHRADLGHERAGLLALHGAAARPAAERGRARDQRGLAHGARPRPRRRAVRAPAYEGLAAYAQSKQANRLWSWALARRLEGSGVTVHALHPGGVNTGIFTKGGGLKGLLGAVYMRFQGRTPDEGADTAVWLCGAPEAGARTGVFWVNRRESPCEFRDPASEDRLDQLCQRLAPARHRRGSAPRPAGARATAGGIPAGLPPARRRWAPGRRNRGRRSL